MDESAGFQGRSSGGRVTVRVNALGQLREVRVLPGVFLPGDEKQIARAVLEASDVARQAAREALARPEVARPPAPPPLEEPEGDDGYWGGMERL
jgi:DNA-binding protein YbaB